MNFSAMSDLSVVTAFSTILSRLEPTTAGITGERHQHVAVCMMIALHMHPARSCFTLIEDVSMRKVK